MSVVFTVLSGSVGTWRSPFSFITFTVHVRNLSSRYALLGPSCEVCPQIKHKFNPQIEIVIGFLSEDSKEIILYHQEIKTILPQSHQALLLLFPHPNQMPQILQLKGILY